MRRAKQEWDYPPRLARHYRVLDAEPTENGWASPTTTRVVNVYWMAIKTIVKVILGSILGLVLFGCLWMIVQIAGHG